MAKLRQILLDALRLRDAEFHFQKYSNRISGSVISDTFKGKGDLKRQHLIWNTLEEALGKDAYRLVGMLLCYTRDEWYVDTPDPLKTAKPKAVKPARTKLAGVA